MSEEKSASIDSKDPSAPPEKPKQMPERLLASFVRPAFHGLKSEGVKDRGTSTKPVDSDATVVVMGEHKKPGSPAAQAKQAAAEYEQQQQGPPPGMPERRARPRVAGNRLPAAEAARLRKDPNHVYEPCLYKRKSGGYGALIFVLIIGVGFALFGLGYLPIDKLFDQGNAAVQSHNDEMVAWINHVTPIVGMVLLLGAGLMIIRKMFFTSKD